jgi:hypothetical protein
MGVWGGAAMVFRRSMWLVVVTAMLATVSASRGEETAKPGISVRPSVEQVAVWRKKLLDIRKVYQSGTGKNQEPWERGKEQLAAIDDPVAAYAIVKLLETEEHAQFRRGLIVPLIKIGGRPAVPALVRWSVEDRNPYLRQEACHGLMEIPDLGEYLDVYLGYLAPVRGKNTRFATEAAEALVMTRLAAPLGPGEKPNEKIVRSLVGALNTAKVEVTQAYDPFKQPVIPDPRDSPESRKRKSPWAEKLPVVATPNPVVLSILQEYTGEDFLYDKQAWLAWLEMRLRE